MRAAVAITLAGFLAFTSSASAFDGEPGRPPPAAQYVEDELLVRFKEHTPKTSMAAAHAEVGATEVRSFANVGDLTLIKLRKALSVDHALESYAKRPDVKYAGDSRDYAGGVFAVYSAAGRVPP